MTTFGRQWRKLEATSRQKSKFSHLNASAQHFASALSHMRAWAFQRIHWLSQQSYPPHKSFCRRACCAACTQCQHCSWWVSGVCTNVQQESCAVSSLISRIVDSKFTTQHDNFTSQQFWEGCTKCLSKSSNVQLAHLVCPVWPAAAAIW